MTKQIFVSYSKKDDEFAFKLVEDLEAKGHDIWIDREIGGGEAWRQVIGQNLHDSDEVIVILTKNSIVSKWVQHESSMAVALDKKMLPLILDDQAADDLPVWAEEIQYFDFRSEYDQPLSDLIDALTPPNPIQDLLEQQVLTWVQTGELFGEAMLRLFEENWTILEISDNANELITLSRKAVENRQRQSRNLKRGLAIIILVIIFGLVGAVWVFNAQARINAALADENANRAAENLAIAEDLKQKTLSIKSRYLATFAMDELKWDPNLALLLSIEAITLDNNFFSFSSLLKTLQYSPKTMIFLSPQGMEGFWGDNLAINSDNTRLALEDGNNQIQLWDISTGKLISVFEGHTERINEIQFSPDGKLIFSCSVDGTIKIWDIDSGVQIGSPLHSDSRWSVNSISISLDGKKLASGHGDGTIMIWDLKSGERIGDPFIGHTELVDLVIFNPDNRTVASSSYDGTVRLWNINSGSQIATPIVNNGSRYGYDIAFSPDGKLLAIGYYNHPVQLWNIETKEIQITLQGEHALSISTFVFSMDGKIIFGGSSKDQSIRLWNTDSGREITQPLIGHTERISDLAYGATRDILVSAAGDGKVIIWELNYRDIESIFQGHNGPILDIDYHPDGHILASGGDDTTIRLWDLITKLQIGDPLIGHSQAVNIVKFDPTGQYLVSGSDDGTLRFWAANSGEQIGMLLDDDSFWINAIAFNSSGSLLAIGINDKTNLLASSSNSNAIIMVDTDNWEITETIWISYPIYNVDFSPDDKYIFASTDANTVFVWELGFYEEPIFTLWSNKSNLTLTTGTYVDSPGGNHFISAYSVWDIAVDPNGRFLASIGVGNILQLWDIETGQFVHDPLFDNGSFWDIEFNPEGTILAAAGLCNQIFLWDVQSKYMLGDININYYNPLEYQILPEESFRIKPEMLWSYQNCENNNEVSSISFSPDGKFLASGGLDGTIHLWSLDIEQWIDAGCRKVGRNFSTEEWNRFFLDEEYSITCDQWPPLTEE